MANSSLNLSSLDFDTLKENFKQFLKTQSVFKDYDFNGSNINVLLDVMAYNSYLNSFFLNMVASEMFLDTAQKYDSVISHAKELNYVPRSARSSSANLNIVFDTNSISSLTIPKETKFIGVNSNGSYIFTTNEAKILTSGNSTFTINDLQIFDGDYFQDSYVVNYDIENQQFLVSNRNVDTNSITVSVIENNGAKTTNFTKAETLFALNSDSEVFFLQATQNNLYEIVFGDGLFGRKPLNAATVVVRYRVSSGIESDGISQFSLFDDLKSVNGGDVFVNSLVVSSNSAGGAEQENIESIRFTAPRYFATQQRAVTSDDYASLVLANFGGEISDVVIYGGQDVEPKLYGRVIVSVKPTNGTIAPDYIKNKISNYLLDYIALPNRVLISDPDYFYCLINTTVQFDQNLTTKTSSEIKTAVLDKILNYSDTNLEKFANDFRYSRLVTEIDNSDSSVVSNDTDVRLIKRLSPKINTPTSYVIETNNVIYYDSLSFETIEQHSLLHKNQFSTIASHASLVSSSFTYISSNGVSYPFAFIEDDAMSINDVGEADVKVYYDNNGTLTPIEKIGKINYLLGTLTLTNLTASTYGNYISLYFRMREKDIFANKNKIINIDPIDVNINVIEVKR